VEDLKFWIKWQSWKKGIKLINESKIKIKKMRTKFKKIKNQDYRSNDKIQNKLK